MIAMALLIAGCGQATSPQARESLAAGAGVETRKR
jgi:hypothetical protein